MEMPVQQVVTGRRIYVHEDSFRVLGADGSQESRAVETLLSESWIFRVALHHIGSDHLIGALNDSEEEVIVDALRERYRVMCSPILAAMKARTPRGEIPLLKDGEVLHATCFDSGYYTFATDLASACRMYADDLSLRSLYSAWARGDGDSDLTMVRGHRLVWGESPPSPHSEETVSLSVTDLSLAALERLKLAVAAGRRQAERRLDGLFG